MNKLKGKDAGLEAAGNITTAQQAFVQALQNKVNGAFSSMLDGAFEMVNYPAGFNWAIQYGPNNYYNQASLAEMDLQVITGSNGIMTLGADPFSSVYDEVLHTISYVISAADQQIINTAEQNAASQIASVIDSWESNFQPVTQAEQQSALPPTKLGYIFQQVAQHWGTDPRNIPNSLADFRTAFQAFQAAAGSAYPIQSAQALATSALQAAMANTENPSAANGALQTGLTSFYVGYTGFPAQNMINSGLQAASNQVTISIALSDFSSSSSQLSVDGGAGIGVSIGDTFGIRINGSASYDLSKYASSSTSMNMSVTYPGITFIASAPLPLNIGGTQGWYSNLILQEAVSNMGKGTTVTGYQIQGSEFSPSDFGPGGKLSRLKTFVISQLPTITLEFQSANSAAVTSDFQEQASVDVSLLGLFNIGSGSQSYQIQKVSTASSDGSVSVTLAPPTVIGTTPAPQSTAFVLGGVPSYPPNAV
jgi:hypothetical protein